MTRGPAGGATVAVVGGGLAGLATAVALAECDCKVELFEARRSLGGRAGSFRDPATGELVDHCQHVSMGCCTNLADFCRRVGIAQFFRRHRRLTFVGPDGRHYRLEGGPLPAPLHLGPAFWRLTYLSVAERLRIGRAMWKLARYGAGDDEHAPTIGQWLAHEGQSARAIERFWSVILVSALGEELDRASLAAARKVIVDGFLASRDAYVVEVPQAPLSTLYGEHLEQWFARHGVALHLGTPVRRVALADGPLVERADGSEARPDFVVIALPWFRLAEVVDASIAAQWPWLGPISEVEASPITGVHLWFDRRIMPGEHAVLVGRLSQWVFHRGGPRTSDSQSEFYYQVVVSASRELAGRSREAIVADVRRELADVWGEAREANLVRWRVVTEHAAVFSARPGLERLRPAQQTAAPGVLVAGDWTATEWPATMESAVRSGYLAAEAVLRSLGRPRRLLVDDLPRGMLARWLIRD
jgi:squalene-associated FAD-dependent desaturase